MTRDQTPSEFASEARGDAGESTFSRWYQGDPPTRVLLRTRHFVVLVDIAPLMLGHLLVIPQQDRLSFASLDDEEWEDWTFLRTSLQEAYTEAFGCAFWLEHGSDDAMARNACITHAHMHLLPEAFDMRSEFLLDGLEVNAIEPSFLRRAIPAGSAYFYAHEEGRLATVGHQRAPSQPSQYLRRIVAAQLGKPEHFDWGVTVPKDVLRETVKIVGPLLEPFRC